MTEPSPSPAYPAVPDHELLRPIGHGSYGEVWLARSVLSELRAVKLVRHSGAGNSGPAGREWEGLRKFEPVSRGHPGLVHILHAGRFDGGFFYTMELADDATGTLVTPQSLDVGIQLHPTGSASAHPPHGFLDPGSYSPRTLRSELQRRERLPIQECLELALKLTDALDYLHRQGLMHRDLKPSNIIFVRGEPKLADIGLVASADASMSCVGTEGYLPPEGPGKPPADLYALGKVLYELATGRDRTDFPELPTLLREDPEREALAELNEVILKACEPEARRRYQTAVEMQADLQLLKSGRSVRWTRGVSRRLALARLGGGVAGGIALLTTGAFWVQRTHTREAQRLQRIAENLAWRAQIQHAEDLFARGESSLALANLAQILRTNPGHGAAADRAVAALSQRIFPRLATPPLPHPNRPVAARFSPDGRTVITLARDRALRFWDVSSGQETRPAIYHSERILSVAFNADGQRLVTTSADGNALVLDGATGAAVLPPLVNESSVIAAAFSPTDPILATASGQHVRWFNVADGSLRKELLSHNATVTGLEFSPDGQWLATISMDSSVRIWETATGGLRQQFSVEGVIERLRVSRNGRWLAVAFQHSETSAWQVRAWDLLSSSDRTVILPHENRIYSLAFSPDHTSLVVGTGNNAARVWDLVTGKLRFILPHSAAVYAAEFSPDGQLIVTASVDKTGRFWEARTGKMATESMSHGARVIQAEFSRDGRRVLTVSWDQTVKLWDVPATRTAVKSLAHPERVNSVEFDPSGRLALTTTSRALFTASRINSWSLGDPQVLSVWDIESGLRVAGPTLPSKAGIVTARWTTAGPLALVARQELTSEKAMSADPEFSNQAQVWDVSTGVPLGGPVAHRRDISAAHFSADGSKLAVGTTRGEIRIWDARRGAALTAPLVHPGWINSVRFSPDGAKLASSSVEGTAMIWDAATGRVLAGPLSHGSEVWLAQFDPSGSRILTATTGHNARIWSVEGELLTDLPQGERAQSRTNGPKPELQWGICDPVEYGEFSPDGRRAVTAAGDRARIWDVSEGKQLTEMVHAQLVVMARFSPDGRRLLTASFDGLAQLWDVETGLKLADPIRHENHVAAIHLSADGRWAMTASNDGTAKVWELPSASLPVPTWFPALLESVAGLRLHPGSIATPVTWAETESLKSSLAAMPSTTALVQWARLL